MTREELVRATVIALSPQNRTAYHPTGSLSITSNGTYNVENVAEAVVNVAGSVEPDRSKMNARYVNCSSDGRWAGPFFNLTQSGTGVTPETETHGLFHPDFTQPFEIHTRFKLRSVPSGRARAFICGTDYAGSYWSNPSFEVGGKLHFFAGFSTTGGAWDTQLLLGGTEHPQDNLPITLDSVYSATYLWDGTVFSFSVSDGEHTATRQADMTRPHYRSTARPFIFGNNARASVDTTGFAMLDMEHTYIKINGDPVWGAGY